MSAGQGGGTATDYIVHHLTNLTVGQGFWTLHLDTLFFSIVLGLIFFFIFRRAAVRATAGVPGGLQNFAEILVEFADRQVKDTFHGRSDLIALTSASSTISYISRCLVVNFGATGKVRVMSPA